MAKKSRTSSKNGRTTDECTVGIQFTADELTRLLRVLADKIRDTCRRLSGADDYGVRVGTAAELLDYTRLEAELSAALCSVEHVPNGWDRRSRTA